jgi:hypothetical protein
MRTTLTIDDALAEALKKRAFESGKPFKQVVNEVIASGLQPTPKPPQQPFVQKTYALGQPMSGVNLDKALQLAGALEDEELARKMEQRK